MWLSAPRQRCYPNELEAKSAIRSCCRLLMTIDRSDRLRSQVRYLSTRSEKLAISVARPRRGLDVYFSEHERNGATGCEDGPSVKVSCMN